MRDIQTKDKASVQKNLDFYFECDLDQDYLWPIQGGSLFHLAVEVGHLPVLIICLF